MLVKQEPGLQQQSADEQLQQQTATFGSAEALQSELERMLAQFSNGSERAVKHEALTAPPELLTTAGDSDDDDDEEEEADGEEEGDEDETTLIKAMMATDGSPADCSSQTTTADHQQHTGGKAHLQQQHQNQAMMAGAAAAANALLPNGKKTKGRVKIKMEYIGNKLRRYTTFSKRKTGIMKKASELSTLTGTQVMLLVASETGHVYAFATSKLKPVIMSEPGKQLIQGCLSASDVLDLAPDRTEFTFEPPALGLAPVCDQGSGRKRKTPCSADSSRPAATGPPIGTPASSSNNGKIPPTLSMAQLFNGTGSSPTASEPSSMMMMPSAAAAEEGAAGLLALEDLFADQRKRARHEASSPHHSSSPSPALAATMDAQQQQKALKEVLKAASENRERLNRQHQQNGTPNPQQQKTAGRGTAKHGPTASGATGASAKQQQHQSLTLGNLMQTVGGGGGSQSSQQLGAALLPILLQGLISSSSSSTTMLPSSMRTSSSPFLCTSSPTTTTVRRPRVSPTAPARPQQQQHQLPILYQMPQGVVYATNTEEEEGEEQYEYPEEEGGGRSRYGIQTPTSCMAAVCSSASSASSAPGLAGVNDDTATGNALQQLLTAGLLPLAAANLTAQQLLATALKGGGAASPAGDD